MTKIPFTLDAWLKDKSQKVVDEDGRPVRIICTDADGLYPIIGLVDNKTPLPCGKDGRPPYIGGGGGVLFIVTPEPELSEFEKVVSEFAKEVMGYTFQEFAGLRNCARQLMIAAREQFIKDGYVIEKKAFHDAVEKVAPEVMKEVSENVDKTNEELTEFERELESFYNHHLQVCTYDNQGTVEDSLHDGASKLLALAKKELCEQIVDNTKEAYENGKAEALKDLPRWESNLKSYKVDEADVIGPWLYYKEHCIRISDLEKLPGFKED